MASLRTTGEGLSIDLSGWERAGALHPSFTVPWRHVVWVEPTSNLWGCVRGIRAPGTGIPRVILLGTMRHNGLKDFAAIYRDLPGVVISLAGEKFARLLLSVPTEQVSAAVAGLGRFSAGLTAPDEA